MPLRRTSKVPKLEKRPEESMTQMRWQSPPVGEKRTVRRFALLPKRMDCGVFVWLEWYLSHEEFCRDWEGYRWKTWKREPIPNHPVNRDPRER